MNKCYILVLLTIIVFNLTINLDRLYSNFTDDYRIHKVEIEGNRHLSTSRIKSLMETSGKGLIDRILFWRKSPPLLEGILENDIQRIINTYQREGFINIRITKTMQKTTQYKVKIQLSIDEGQRVIIDSINYSFPDNLNSLRDTHEEHLKNIKGKSIMTAGDYFIDENLHSDLKMISDYYNQTGYPYITTDYSLNLNEEDKTVTIIIYLNPGNKASFGEINYEGLTRTDEKMLEKLLAFNYGDQYDRNKLVKTRTNLQTTGLFRFVSVNIRLETDKTNIPVEIFLREKDNITMNFGVGFGIEDRLRIYNEITKMRFLGGLRTGTLFLKHSSLEPINIDLKITQPVFPTINSSLVLNPFYRREEEPAYSLERKGVNNTLNHSFSSAINGFVTYSFEDNQLRSVKDTYVLPADTLIYDPTIEQRYYRKSSINLGLLYDTAKPDFFPTKGSFMSNVFTISGLGFDSDYSFLRNLTDIRYYYTLNSSLVIATRIKLGFIKLQHTDPFIPYEDRFYAGGAFSVRGWQRAQLGPKNADDDPLGGNSYLEGSIEFRYPLWHQLSAVTFLDYGNVWEDEFAHQLSDIRYAAGSGLRYATPVGPIRLDIATPVFEARNPVQFFISLGQTF